MEFNELISQHRALYVEDLLNGYAKQPEGLREVLIAYQNEEPVNEFKLWRVDHMIIVDGKPSLTELNSDRYLNYETMEFRFENLHVILSPFHWNGCEFIISPKPDNYEWLINWISKWIDELDSKPQNEEGLQCVIHSVTRPQETPDSIQFSVDFGSATVDAFHNLINEIYLLNSSTLKIGSNLVIA